MHIKLITNTLADGYLHFNKDPHSNCNYPSLEANMIFESPNIKYCILLYVGSYTLDTVVLHVMAVFSSAVAIALPKLQQSIQICCL